MRDAYTTGTEEILRANEQLRAKIQFLQTSASARECYLQDLKQSLRVNKMSLRAITTTQKHPLVGLLEERETAHESLVTKLYSQNNSLAATLLMEKQMRIQDSAFYNERLKDFQNCIVDLRKFLHDKEDSFSSVINRLKKYEDVGEAFLKEKLVLFKDFFQEDIAQEVISNITQERNFYKHKFNEMVNGNSNKTINSKELLPKGYNVSNEEMKTKLFNNPNNESCFQASQQHNLCIGCSNKFTQKLSSLSPNKQLIRLLKKQKLSNQILEQALNESIDKNEELFIINEELQNELKLTEKNYEGVLRENAILNERMDEYNMHYNRQVFAKAKSLRALEHSKEEFRNIMQFIQSQVESIKFGIKMKIVKGSKSVREGVHQWEDQIQQVEVLEY